MRFTMMYAGGANLFLFDGEVRFSTTEHRAIQPRHQRKLREVHGPRRADIVQKSFSLLPQNRIELDTGERWTMFRSNLWSDRCHCDTGDGSVGYDLELTGDGGITVMAGDRQLAASVDGTVIGLNSDHTWTINAVDDINPWWLACLLTALTANASRLNYAFE